MVHKTKEIKYDEYGDPINLDPKEKKWLDYKRFFRFCPEKLLRKEFDHLWEEQGNNFDAIMLEHNMAPILKKYNEER